MIFDALTNAAYRGSLHDQRAELEREGVKHPPARRIRRRAYRPGVAMISLAQILSLVTPVQNFETNWISRLGESRTVKENSCQT